MSYLIIIILITIGLSAFFSGIEIAFVSANKLKIELDKSRNKLSGKILSWFNQREVYFIAMLLLGNNIAIVIYGIFTERLFVPIFTNYFPAWLSTPIIFLFINTIVSTLIILILAEFIPKATFRINANRSLDFFSLPLVVIYYLLFPFVFAFIKASEFILKYIFRTKINSLQYQFSTVDLDHYIQEFHQESAIENEEIKTDIQIFRNAIDFRTTKIRECMIPRTDIKSIEKNDSIENLLQLFNKTGHSKILVYEENIDHIVGYVHAYDLIKTHKTITETLRNIPFIPETMAANVMLNKMIKERNSIAVVLDEFGGTAGIITLEDLMEEIFGEIEDEFDKEDLIEKELKPNTYLFSARLKIDYLNQEYNLMLEVSDEYETLGGFVTHFCENIPEKGVMLNIGNHTFEIIQAGENKLDIIKLYKNSIDIS